MRDARVCKMIVVISMISLCLNRLYNPAFTAGVTKAVGTGTIPGVNYQFMSSYFYSPVPDCGLGWDSSLHNFGLI